MRLLQVAIGETPPIPWVQRCYCDI